MEGSELLRILYGTFLGLFLIAMGFLTFTTKDEPGIGFRIGYTYLSRRARMKANRVSGIGMMITGVSLVILSPFLSFALLNLLLLLSLGVTLSASYMTAKREYELDELSEEAPEKPGRRIWPPNLKMYIALQAAFLAIFVGLYALGRVPGETAVVLDGGSSCSLH